MTTYTNPRTGAYTTSNSISDILALGRVGDVLNVKHEINSAVYYHTAKIVRTRYGKTDVAFLS